MGDTTPSGTQDQLILTTTLFDPNIERHENLLINLLKGSENSKHNGAQMFLVQKEVEPWMRDQVVKWMLEVVYLVKSFIFIPSHNVNIDVIIFGGLNLGYWVRNSAGSKVFHAINLCLGLRGTKVLRAYIFSICRLT